MRSVADYIYYYVDISPVAGTTCPLPLSRVVHIHAGSGIRSIWRHPVVSRPSTGSIRVAQLVASAEPAQQQAYGSQVGHRGPGGDQAVQEVRSQLQLHQVPASTMLLVVSDLWSRRVCVRACVRACVRVFV